MPFRDVRVLKFREIRRGELRVNGLETDPGYLCTGRNGAYQAVNFAVHTGASRIILLGVDCRDGPAGPHWHGKHPGALRNPDKGTYGSWIAAWATMPAALPSGVSVVNCSPGSAVTAFPLARLEEVI